MIFLKNIKNPPSEFRENLRFDLPREARRKFCGIFAPENSDFVQNQHFLKRVLLKTPVQIGLTFENIKNPPSKLAAEI